MGCWYIPSRVCLHNKQSLGAESLVRVSPINSISQVLLHLVAGRIKHVLVNSTGIGLWNWH